MAILIFLIAISVMILVHELGHFLMAKWKDLKVEEFGLGYPPKLIGKKIGETLYSLNAIPMGGFVRIWGMEQRVKKDKKRAFYTQSAKTQFLILLAGVIMNFFLAVGIFSLYYGVQGVPRRIDAVKIVYIAPDSPADKANLKVDEKIIKIKTEEKDYLVEDVKEFSQVVDEYAEEEIVLVSSDGGEYSLVPREKPPEDEGALGVIISDHELKKIALWKRIPLGVWFGVKEGVLWGVTIIEGIFNVFWNLFQGRTPKEVTGPIGIYSASRDIFKREGLLSLVHFFAIVSVNLAIVNLIPIPGTDGWHASILSFELIRGKDIKESTKTKINQAAMIFILLLSALIIAADVKRFLL